MEVGDARDGGCDNNNRIRMTNGAMPEEIGMRTLMWRMWRRLVGSGRRGEHVHEVHEKYRGVHGGYRAGDGLACGGAVVYAGGGVV